jgi:hypothetical protein
MHTVKIPFRKRLLTYTFASNWQEVPPSVLPWLGQHLWQMVDLYQQLIAQVKADKHLEAVLYDSYLQDLRLEMFRRLMGVTRNPLSLKNRAFYSMYPDELKDCMDMCRFIFEKIDLEEPPVKRFFYGGKFYHAPAKNFDNLTGGEFHFLETVLTKAQKGDIKALRLVAALLYRPAGKTVLHTPNHPHYCGDVREPFNQYIWEQRAHHFRYLSKDTLYTILLWASGRRVNIISNYTEIFSGDGEESGEGWLSVFRQLSPNRMDFESIAAKKLKVILYELTKINEENEREKRRIEQQKLLR